MNPVHPWLDADEVKRLAEQLMRPAPMQNAFALQNAGFGREFVGFAEKEPGTVVQVIPSPPLPTPPHPVPDILPPIPMVSPVVEKPVPAPIPVSIPPPADLVPEEPASPPVSAPTDVEPATTPRSSFLERIRQYRDWMHGHFSATGLFILDREGAVIFDEGTNGRLHFLARSLALASRRPGTAATNVHVKIGVGATLEVIPVDTPFGCLVLGAVVPEALNQEAVHLIMQGLVQTIRQPGHLLP